MILLEVARQICLFDYENYIQIEPKELLNQAWNKDKENAPYVRKMIESFNYLSNFVQSRILSFGTPKERGRQIANFLKILSVLRENHNFNGCQSIVAGLTSSSIFRLTASWHVARKDKQLALIYDDIVQTLSSDGSYSRIRKTLKNLDPPIIPYMGMYLTDLTFIEDGNPNYLRVDPPRDDIINFEKNEKSSCCYSRDITISTKTL